MSCGSMSGRPVSAQGPVGARTTGTPSLRTSGRVRRMPRGSSRPTVAASTFKDVVQPSVFDVAVNVAVKPPSSGPSKAPSERGIVVSPVGFEPTTRGSKVSVEAVHGVIWRAFLSMPRGAYVHGLHGVGPKTTDVAVSRKRRPCRQPQAPMAAATRSQARSSTPSGVRSPVGRPENGDDLTVNCCERHRARFSQSRQAAGPKSLPVASRP